MVHQTPAREPGQTVLVVPCYNEAARLDTGSFESFDAPCVRFLFVDDGSTDDTASVLQRLHESRPDRFEVLRLEHNGGKAEAVRAGVARALESGPRFVGFWDADLSTPLDELPGFLEVMERRPDVRMVFGSRVNLLGRSVRRKLWRHYVGRVFATAVATVLRLPVYDTQCGAKLFRLDDEIARLFAEPFLSKWIFDVEIIARFIRARRDSGGPPAAVAIFEQPLMSWYDVEGSKLRLRDFVVVSLDFARIWRRYLRRAAP